MKMKFPQLKSSRPLSLVTRGGVVFFAVLVLQAVFSSFSLPTQHSLQKLQDPSPEWVLYSTVSNVDFYYRFGDCSGKKVVFLKLNNRNTRKVKVSWKEVFKTQFEAQKEGARGTKQLTLVSGETSLADCANMSTKELVVLPGQVNPTYLADIQRFDFKNITVVNL